MHSVTKLLIGVLFAGFSLVAEGRDVAVVAGKSDSLQAVAAQDLAKICSGKMLKWPDGRDIKVFVSDPTSPGMAMIAEKLLKISPQEFRALLQKTPGVVVLGSDREVVASVQKAPGSIGFVDVYSITSGISVLRVEGKLPFDAGYLLHRSQ
jgi:ABC-type phosphate transport system substrate-binding protein